MPFSPNAFGPVAAASLDALASLVYKCPDENHWQFRRFTEPEGTELEAELLLSPSGMQQSAIVRAMLLQEEHIETKFSKLCVSQTEKIVDRKQHLIHAFLRLRGSIQVVEEEDQDGEGSPIFSDTLFGPSIAKVLNGLLALETSYVNNRTHHHHLSPHHASELQHAAADDPSLRRPFVLHRQGTAFAAEWLVLQYMHNQDEYELSIRHNHFGLRDALFPRFGELSSRGDFNAACHMAMQQIHREMHHIHTAVNLRAVPVLMGCHERLGRASPLQGMNDEVLGLILSLL